MHDLKAEVERRMQEAVEKELAEGPRCERVIEETVAVAVEMLEEQGRKLIALKGGTPQIAALVQRAEAAEHNFKVEHERAIAAEKGCDEAAEKEISRLSACLNAVSGALCDGGGPVPREARYGEAVREVVKERDEARKAIAAAQEQITSINADSLRLDALAREEIAALKKSLADLKEKAVLTEAFDKDGTPINWKGSALANAAACGGLADELETTQKTLAEMREKWGHVQRCVCGFPADENAETLTRDERCFTASGVKP